ncbi:Holliday junction branch migration protein RuvA [Candidatus Parcubacteria bacterium]|nr:Holliday junction branch migration protein RuvA [Candidatus Parcubacteria bacterium]
MISYLEGKIIETNLDSIILSVNGVGYLIHSTPDLLQIAEAGNEISIWTYLAVRENALDLYGFKEKKDLSLFKLLLTISGVGPKSAISILSNATAETLISGIQSNDPAYLSKMSGIGKKTAEKIVVSLKDKLGTTEFGENNTNNSENHNVVAIDALVSLGYSERDARETVSKIKGLENPEDIIKKALKDLSN